MRGKVAQSELATFNGPCVHWSNELLHLFSSLENDIKAVSVVFVKINRPSEVGQLLGMFLNLCIAVGDIL